MTTSVRSDLGVVAGLEVVRLVDAHDRPLDRDDDLCAAARGRGEMQSQHSSRQQRAATTLSNAAVGHWELRCLLGRRNAVQRRQCQWRRERC